MPVASTQTVSVNYATANGTATSGSDYAATSGTLTFAPGETSKTITVAVTGDTLSEPNETFFLNLTNAVGASISDGQGQGTIQDDEPPVITINDISFNEGNQGSKVVTFTVSLDKAAPAGGISFSYATANGTATASSDFTSVTGTVSIAAGQKSGTISVTILGDKIKEVDETFFVNLSNPTNGAILADSQGVATIVNDDKTGKSATGLANSSDGNNSELLASDDPSSDIISALSTPTSVSQPNYPTWLDLVFGETDDSDFLKDLVLDLFDRRKNG
jgi:hypothetical protein